MSSWEELHLSPSKQRLIDTICYQVVSWKFFSCFGKNVGWKAFALLLQAILELLSIHVEVDSVVVIYFAIIDILYISKKKKWKEPFVLIGWTNL